jgi:uncharacterized protein YeeX (DUF496 family)
MREGNLGVSGAGARNAFGPSGKTTVNGLMLPLLAVRPYDTPPIGNAWAELSKDELKSEISKLEKKMENLWDNIRLYLDGNMGYDDRIGELIESLRSDAEDLEADHRAAKAELKRRPKDFDEVLDEIYKLRDRSRVFISRDQAELDKMNETIDLLIANDLPTTRPTLKHAKKILRESKDDVAEFTNDLDNDKHRHPTRRMGDVQEQVLLLMRKDSKKIIRVLEEEILPFVSPL